MKPTKYMSFRIKHVFFTLCNVFFRSLKVKKNAYAPRHYLHNTPIHNILSTAPQLCISQKALGTLPEDGNVMPKHVGATINN
jgi:hypothetical protein